MSKGSAERVKGYLPEIADGDAIAIIWGAADIHCRARDIGVSPRLTDEEVRTVLYDMSHRHDADIGISWTVIDVYIEDAVDARSES